jgi:hypothetical protein
MIKNRFFMLGLGAGMIAGALLLQLMLAGRAVPLTKEQLVKEAAKLNLTVVDKTETGAEGTPAPENGAQDQGALGTAEPSAPAVSASPSPAATPKAAAKPSAAVTPGQPSAPSKPAGDATGTGAVPPASPTSPEVDVNGNISVRIPTGITMTQTADLLVEAGVIQDKAKFLQTANSRKANKIIQYGSYSFAKGESINSIIDKLITVKQ